jgi:hypothetical protein
MDYTKVMSEIRSMFNAGESCVVVVRKSADSSMNKGRGANRNPLLGRVTVEKRYAGYAMGCDYPTQVGNTATRLGNETSRDEVQLKQNWHKRIDGWFSTDKRTESKFYLKLSRNEAQIAHKVEAAYYVDGHPATEQEMYLIKSWLKPKSHTQSSTQTELGIDKAHEIEFLLPQLDTIIAIKQGERFWTPQEFTATSIEVGTPAYVKTTSQG